MPAVPKGCTHISVGGVEAVYLHFGSIKKSHPPCGMFNCVQFQFGSFRQPQNLSGNFPWQLFAGRQTQKLPGNFPGQFFPRKKAAKTPRDFPRAAFLRKTAAKTAREFPRAAFPRRHWQSRSQSLLLSIYSLFMLIYIAHSVHVHTGPGGAFCCCSYLCVETQKNRTHRHHLIKLRRENLTPVLSPQRTRA